MIEFEPAPELEWEVDTDLEWEIVFTPDESGNIEADNG